MTTSGANVTATDASWYANLGSGASTTFRFLGTDSGTTTPPTLTRTPT